MTIAAGFICSDGLLFASDTLYSGQVNRYGRKFWTFDHGDVCVVFGGAGTERGLLRTRDEIGAGLSPGMSLRDVVRTIDAALTDVNARMQSAPEDRTYALVGIQCDGSQALYHNDGGGSMLSPVNDSSQCVGYASSLGFYFTRQLFTSRMPLRWAKVVAAYLIKQCRDHSGYCGGKTNLIELPLNHAPRVIDDKTEIDALEAHLSVIDDAMRIILPDERSE